MDDKKVRQLIFAIGEAIGVALNARSKDLVVLIPEDYWKVLDETRLYTRGEAVASCVENPSTIMGVRCRPTKEKAIIVGVEKAIDLGVK